eukprot:7236313-Pyramimonas_sp.AAC.1
MAANGSSCSTALLATMSGSSCVMSAGISGLLPSAIWHGENPWTRRREFLAMVTARTQASH